MMSGEKSICVCLCVLLAFLSGRMNVHCTQSQHNMADEVVVACWRLSLSLRTPRMQTGDVMLRGLIQLFIQGSELSYW